MTAKTPKTSTGKLTSKLMLSGALILGSGAYAWWMHGVQPGVNAPILAKTSAAPAKVAVLAPPAAPPQQQGIPAVPPPQAISPVAKPQSSRSETPTVQQYAPSALSPPATIVTSNAPTPAPAPAPSPPAQLAGRYADGDFTGQSADTAWGTVQVRVSMQGGAIADVEPIDYPAHRRRSIQINEWALPILAREVIQAQSADVDIVSQATTTSVGYLQSLATALAQAKK